MKFIFILLAFLFSNVAHAESFDHLKKSSWNVTPKVLICKDSGVSLDTAARAVSFWNDMGFKVSSPVLSDCEDDTTTGHIIIKRDPGDIFQVFYNGATVVHLFRNTKTISHADVYVNKTLVDQVDVLKHEIGHAVGLEDEREISSSVMVYRKAYR